MKIVQGFQIRKDKKNLSESADGAIYLAQNRSKTQ